VRSETSNLYPQQLKQSALMLPAERSGKGKEAVGNDWSKMNGRHRENGHRIPAIERLGLPPKRALAPK